MMIKTKIVATIGPASWERVSFKRLVKAGTDVVRINFSHGTAEQRQKCLDTVRSVSRQMGEPLAVMGDLCGPKIRVGQITGGSVLLPKGATLIIQRKAIEGTAKRISTTLAELIDDVDVGERISMDDGKIRLKVVEIHRPRRIICKVLTGGMLSSGKGVNLPQTDLKLSALTEKDLRDAAWIAERDFDYVALSFVQRPDDIRDLRDLLTKGGSTARIIAKIEKPQAMKNIHAIIDEADGILVARGDMGIEMSLPEVPIAQKRLADLCERRGKLCIIATQMLETMTESPMPTRAEVSDVANAVLDGADAVMLSGETAVGKYPERAVKMMDAIVKRTESYAKEFQAMRAVRCELSDTEAALASAVHSIVQTEKVRAVVVFTKAGGTAQRLSKTRIAVPILALTPSPRVLQQTCLMYGVYGVMAKTPRHTSDVIRIATREVQKLKWAKKGDRIIVVSGRPLGQPGSCNSLVVHTV